MQTGGRSRVARRRIRGRLGIHNCSYHYGHGEEEWLIVLSGSPTLRTTEGVERLAAWDVVCFPAGPAGAHAVRNDSDETARVLMYSSIRYPPVTSYPDSDKIGAWTGDREQDLVVRRSSGVGYYDGETGA